MPLKFPIILSSNSSFIAKIIHLIDARYAYLVNLAAAIVKTKMEISRIFLYASGNYFSIFYSFLVIHVLVAILCVYEASFTVQQSVAKLLYCQSFLLYSSLVSHSST